jgi:coenzyme F420-0:L-glutamate ligase/coenzyme F420-1:gamma-L-glutamate ligase
MNRKQLEVIPIQGFPLIKIGDDISSLILEYLQKNDIRLYLGDILVVTHSIISIAEGSLYEIEKIEPSKKAVSIADITEHKPVKTEIALQESVEVIREYPVMITKTKQGIITDYSGVDESNAPLGTMIALPKNPDLSALNIHKALSSTLGFSIPVIICDTQGRPWRKGAVNLAIGIAGMSPFIDNAGRKDLYDRRLRSSLVCLADELASAAELVMGQADEGIPLAIIRGAEYKTDDGTALQIPRSSKENLFD